MTVTSRIPKLLQMFATMVVTSFFIFPFPPSFIPFRTHSKMILAALGVAILVYENLIQNRSFYVSKSFLTFSFFASLVGLVSFTTMLYNRTPDNEFVDYVISAWVWMGGAYTAMKLMKRVHGTISVEIFGNYLIAVCTAQCIVAYSMTFSTGVADFINSLQGPGEAYLSDAKGRLHGLGCALDPAGFRFSATLIILSTLLCHRKADAPGYVPFLYLFCFFVISVFGNMISRSTMIGMGIGLAYMGFHTVFIPSGANSKMKTWGAFFILALILIPIGVFFYNTNEVFYEWMRFGFEGFFSLAEKGEWDVESNNILKGMVVYPESTKTWIIGDGYITYTYRDPYYLGERHYLGYYMDTDIGYLRYIFYFGIIGLVTFGMVFIVAAVICSKKFPEYTLMFLLMALSNYIGWIKVSTDIFCMFAPFLVIVFEKNREEAREDRLLHPLRI